MNFLEHLSRALEEAPHNAIPELLNALGAYMIEERRRWARMEERRQARDHSNARILELNDEIDRLQIAAAEKEASETI